MIDRAELYQRILERIGKAEFDRVRTRIGSSTLRDAMELLIDAQEGIAQLFIKHYWAEFYHDGRGPVGPVDKRFVVFFMDPKDDPRLEGGYPVRASDIVTLTEPEFRYGRQKNAERRAEGGEPYMIVIPNSVRDEAGPAGPHPFFDDLAIGAADRATAIVTEEMDVFVQDLVDNDRDVRPEKDTATFVL